LFFCFMQKCRELWRWGNVPAKTGHSKEPKLSDVLTSTPKRPWVIPDSFFPFNIRNIIIEFLIIRFSSKLWQNWAPRSDGRPATFIRPR
jgi:hypothetical protein